MPLPNDETTPPVTNMYFVCIEYLFVSFLFLMGTSWMKMLVLLFFTLKE